MNIHWEERKLIGSGCNGIVYKIHDTAVKVGVIYPIEVAQQCYFAAKGMAVPVYLYREQEQLPKDVIYELCTTHNTRNTYYQLRHRTVVSNAADVLVMGLAETNLEVRDDINAFVEKVHSECLSVFGFNKDINPSNIGYYKNRLVALDFGK